MGFHNLQRLLDEVSEVLPLPLRIVHGISGVLPLVLEDVEHGQDLPVSRHERLPNHVTGQHQGLNDLEECGDDRRVSRIQRRRDYYRRATI